MRVPTLLATVTAVVCILACGGDVRNFREVGAVPADFPLTVDNAHKITMACASRSYADGPVMGHQVLVEPRFGSADERDARIDVWMDDLKADGWTVRANDRYFGREQDQLDIDTLPGSSRAVFLTWWTPGCDHEDGELL